MTDGGNAAATVALLVASCTTSLPGATDMAVAQPVAP